MLSRDARHIALPQVGVAGQQRIAAGSALLIGIGGIGCATAMYLASSGVGRLLLSDFDTIDETNLGRQVLYTPNDLGELKADVAAERLRIINPNIKIDTIAERMSGSRLHDAVDEVDVVLDGSDNFATRFQVSDACVAANRPLVSGAAIRMEGQIAVFGPDYSISPCYRCLYSEADESLESCAGNGVLSPLPGVIGSMMAVEALKLLARIGPAASRLHLYDAAATEFRSVAIRKRMECGSCAASTQN